MRRIIRVYAQSIKSIPYSELKSDLESNGLTIFKSAGSHLSECFFIEVSGDYTGKLTIDKTDIDINTFDWLV
jgi:hypothetical protein